MSLLAVSFAIFTWIQTQHQIRERNAVVVIVTKDRPHDQVITLVKAGGEYLLKVPVRSILTNRSSKTQPLIELSYTGRNGTEFIRTVADKYGVSESLPLNIPPDESRVLTFSVSIRVAGEAAEFLIAQLPSESQMGPSEWSITESGNFGSFCLRLNDPTKAVANYLLYLQESGRLIYDFAAAADSRRFVMEEDRVLP